jgi:hypothetical protein
MPRPKNVEALQQECLSPGEPPAHDHAPDRFEELFGAVGGAYRSRSTGKIERIGLGATTNDPPRDLVRKRALEWLNENPGWHTSLEISANIKMKAGDLLTHLRHAGKIQARKHPKGIGYEYSRLENEK